MEEGAEVPRGEIVPSGSGWVGKNHNSKSISLTEYLLANASQSEYLGSFPPRCLELTGFRLDLLKPLSLWCEPTMTLEVKSTPTWTWGVGVLCYPVRSIHSRFKPEADTPQSRSREEARFDPYASQHRSSGLSRAALIGTLIPQTISPNLQHSPSPFSEPHQLATLEVLYLIDRGPDSPKANTALSYRISIAAAPCLPSLDHPGGVFRVPTRWLVSCNPGNFSKLSCMVGVILGTWPLGGGSTTSSNMWRTLSTPLRRDVGPLRNRIDKVRRITPQC